MSGPEQIYNWDGTTTWVWSSYSHGGPDPQWAITATGFAALIGISLLTRLVVARNRWQSGYMIPTIIASFGEYHQRFASTSKRTKTEILLELILVLSYFRSLDAAVHHEVHRWQPMDAHRVCFGQAVRSFVSPPIFASFSFFLISLGFALISLAHAASQFNDSSRVCFHVDKLRHCWEVGHKHWHG